MPNTLARPPRNPGESFSVSMRRSTAVGIFISLLVHVVAFLIVMPKIAEQAGESVAASRAPISVRVRVRQSELSPPPTLAPPTPTPPAATPPVRSAPQRPQRTPPPSRAPVITQRGPSSRSAPPTTPGFKDTPLPPPLPTPPDEAAPDMMSDLRARQDARKSRESRDGVTASGSGTANGDDVDSRIAANLARRPSTGNGIFQIRDLGVRTAEVYFRGWGDDPRNWRGELFPVDAGMGGDVEAAVVDTVIRRIRRDYQETDFDWESHRLNRVIKLSARKKDTAELAAFLRIELFGKQASR